VSLLFPISSAFNIAVSVDVACLSLSFQSCTCPIIREFIPWLWHFYMLRRS
jgi:hypothetical protein